MSKNINIVNRMIPCLLILSLSFSQTSFAESQKYVKKGGDGFSLKTQSTNAYIKQLETENGIQYSKITHSRGAYVTSMCYTKTYDDDTGKTYNPCYSCHTKGILPNYYNDTNLQFEYNFPKELTTNPYSNLFKDKTADIAAISDTSILKYIRQSNYFDPRGKIELAEKLPQNWAGYRPDCYFNFDQEGFDKSPEGQITGWRAFRYYPFLGTFWPSNGSTDDVLIRLDKRFAINNNGQFDLSFYKLNLSIVEALIKQKDIPLSQAINEQDYGVDLNHNGHLDKAKIISAKIQSYVGQAKKDLANEKIHLALGLFPENTEFLHSVRYLDWDDAQEHIKLSARMKELRYAKKIGWSSYSQINRMAKSELWEIDALDSTKAQLVTFRGNYEHGLNNPNSWVYQGFIEDKKGDLRPQTHEETIACMGCHSHLGATTDSVFAFPRKFTGIAPNQQDYGWNHWSQKGLIAIAEPKVSYKDYGEQYEYSFYLQNNHSGNEFRDNQEVIHKFFNKDGTANKSSFKQLHQDISILLFPSKQRALKLNKAYKTIVDKQSYIFGRDANATVVKNVYKTIKDKQLTGITQGIIRK